MKKLQLSIFASGLLCSCANTSFIGHKTGYDINTEIKSDMSSPVSINVGFESHSGVAVPPKNSLKLKDLSKSEKIAEGQVLPTISRLSVERVTDTVTNDVDFDYVTLTATGQSAINVTKHSFEPKKTEEDKSSNLASQIATEAKTLVTREAE